MHADLLKYINSTRVNLCTIQKRPYGVLCCSYEYELNTQRQNGVYPPFKKKKYIYILFTYYQSIEWARFQECLCPPMCFVFSSFLRPRIGMCIDPPHCPLICFQSVSRIGHHSAVLRFSIDRAWLQVFRTGHRHVFYSHWYLIDSSLKFCSRVVVDAEVLLLEIFLARGVPVNVTVMGWVYW